MTKYLLWSLCIAVCLCQWSNAQDKLPNPHSTAYRNPYGKLPSSPTVGDQMFVEYFYQRSSDLSKANATTFRANEDWKEHKDEYRAQLFEMLSLNPLPTKTDLHATVTGTLDEEEFTVEKLHFQSMPGLYCTANVYVPKNLTASAPAILYVCGHGQVKKDNISYGNKVHYQHHGAWFARNGYVCMVMDTVQLGELEGVHHGIMRESMWWWNSRGYTPAGTEAWNCIRALDYLQSRPDVDGERMGVTGRSGGGAYSWWIAALDERIKAACPVAGITDMQNHVVDGCVEGHCDCMYMVNTYRWDFAKVAALVAPRPLLICNTDKDGIFPIDGVVRLHAQVRAIYDQYRAPDKLGLAVTEGPHKDTQELQMPVMRWFNKWLKDDLTPVANYAKPYFQPEQLKVFKELPSEEITTRCYESFTPVANESQQVSSDEIVRQLREQTFGAWPTAGDGLDSVPAIHKLLESSNDDLTFAVYEFESQPQVRLRLYVLKDKFVAPNSAQLLVADDMRWDKHIASIGSIFPEALKEAGAGSGTTESQAKEEAETLVQKLKKDKSCLVLFAPRAVGYTRLSQDESFVRHVRRRMMLLGETLASSQVWDVVQAAKVVPTIAQLESAPIHLVASPEMTEVCTFAVALGCQAKSLSLDIAPRSDKVAPDFLNWSRIVTAKQLLGLASEKTQVSVGD